MNRERSILHLNVADFAVAVERVADTTLRNRPVIVAPLQAARAAVYDMSDEAYGDGVRKGMLLSQAAGRCRRAVILPPRLDLYRRAMTGFVSRARSYSPLLEHGEEDGHLFVDLTGTHRLFGAAPDVGWRLRREVKERLGIEPIWSLGPSKLVAKVASRLVKPVGEYIVAAGEEESFLAPLALLLLPGLTTAEQRCLQRCSIDRIGQLAALSRPQLFSVFGGRGDTLYNLCRGIDDGPVQPAEGNRQPSIAFEHVFADDTADKGCIVGTITGLAVRIGMKLRRDRLAGRRLGLFLYFSDGSRVVRQATARRGISGEAALRELALLALERALTRRTRVRSCRLVCDRLQPESPQLFLFAEPETDRQARLDAALDAVRRSFGVNAIRTGRQPALQ